jgi:hypothetical protein
LGQLGNVFGVAQKSELGRACALQWRQAFNHAVGRTRQLPTQSLDDVFKRQ